ncbi:RNA exonuclease 5 [Pelodytes ibericus]
MADEKSLNDRKRPSRGSVTERKLKKKCVESECRQKINGSELQNLKKPPRISPALFRDDCVIQHKQLHQLLKYASLGKGHNASQSSWCRVHHQKRLHGAVVIVLQDLNQLHFYRFYLHFRFLRTFFKYRFSLPPPSSDFMASLVGLDLCDVTNGRTKNFDNNHKSTSDLQGFFSVTAKKQFLQSPIVRKYGNEKQGMPRYLLSKAELRKNDYPLIGCEDTAHFVDSGCTGEITDNSPLFGLDCEMCLTDKGTELTRISLVDANGKCIMDELVKPDNIIQNYLTRFSGITRKMLLPVTTKLKDVQEKLKSLLPPNAVLVGHSLNHDLKALQMIHTNVIDTALLFAGEFGRKFKLKFLTQVFLRREIQCEDVVGHNPCEDAKAALNLAQFFIQQGPEAVAQFNLDTSFGNMNKPNGSLACQKDPSVVQPNGVIYPLDPITKQRPLSSESHSLVESLYLAGRKITYVTKMGNLKSRLSSKSLEFIRCTSDEEVLERACDLVPEAQISFVEFCPEIRPSECNEDMNATVKSRFTEMMTIYAGPFKKDLCLKSIKRRFKSCGPIHSLSIVAETYQPFICIKYCVLEAAQLALEKLNDTYIDGCSIKVQRLITLRTLDCEDLLKEMEEDLENKDVIYVSGFRKHLTEEFLQQQFSNLKDIKAIFLPKKQRNGRPAKHCYLKFHSSQSAVLAADYITGDGELRSRKALTASHLHHWLADCVHLETACNQESFIKEQDLTPAIKNVDRKVKQLYQSLKGNTLCLVLFPGKNSADGSFPGFGLMGITEGS